MNFSLTYLIPLSLFVVTVVTARVLYFTKMGNRAARERRDVYIDKIWVKKTIETEAASDGDILALATRIALKRLKYKFYCSSYTIFKELLMIYNENDFERTVAHVSVPCAMAILANKEYNLHPVTLTRIICEELSLPWIINV